jgi:hypothetical protein
VTEFETLSGRAKGRAWMDAKIEERAEIAASNRAERAKRSPLEQMKVLDRRLGYGRGATKERARLQALVNGQPWRESA